MKGLLDLVAILSGVFGLAGIIFGGTPLTPETASLYTARAAIVIAFVVIPFYMARAIDKLHAQIVVNNFQPVPVRKQRHVHELHQLESKQSEITYFDYFFQPGSAQEWQATSRNTTTMRNAPDGNNATGKK